MIDIENIVDVLRNNLPDDTGVTQLGILIFYHMKQKNSYLKEIVLKLHELVDKSSLDNETRLLIETISSEYNDNERTSS